MPLEPLSRESRSGPQYACEVDLEPPEGVPEPALDRLYRGPIERFTPARNELAKSLRSEGEAAAADWVKALKKPTRAAWLVNQLSQRKSAAVKKLLDAGAELRRRQEELGAGAADRDALRKAADREQRAIDSLLRTAEAVGREHKVGTQILDRVGETLQAASSDPEVARAIELGRLDRERRAVGLGLVGPAPSSPGKGYERKAKDAEQRRARERQARRRKQAERAVATAERKVERERTAVEKAREALEQREKRLKDAEHDLRTAQRELE